MHVSVNVQIFPCNALYRAFAVRIWVGSDRPLQRAVPPRYHFITARALYYNARYRLGTARALYFNARYRLGTARALHYNARYRLGTARALHYNARHRLGTARALYYNAQYRHPACVLQSFNWIGVMNFQESPWGSFAPYAFKKLPLRTG